jgi:hypothetical protein
VGAIPKLLFLFFSSGSRSPLASDPYQHRWYGFRTNGKYRKKEFSSSLCLQREQKHRKKELLSGFQLRQISKHKGLNPPERGGAGGRLQNVMAKIGKCHKNLLTTALAGCHDYW